MPDFTLELECLAPVAGIDEAGRGPWAGPVVAAAVILESGRLPVSLHEGLDDSKKLSAKRREELFAILPDYAVIGVGVAEVEEIDRINILRASLLAMTRAVAALGVVPAMALVDGNQPPTLPCPVRCVVGGDGLSLSIAAASIIAKVTRDRLMHDLHREFPVYGWHTNAGYGTPEHQKGLAQHGVTPHHRRSFAPIRRLIESV